MPRRPPKCWWYSDKLNEHIEEQYPDASEKRVARIKGGIWRNYSSKQKKKIIKKCEDEDYEEED